MQQRNTVKTVVFSAEDLEYNRRGEYSPRQRAAMRADGIGCFWILGLFAGLCALVVAGGFVPRADVPWQIAALAGIAGGVALWFGLDIWFFFSRPSVKAVTGTVEVVVDRSTIYNYKHNIIVGTVVFHTDHLLPRAFEAGTAYAFYYFGSTTNNILSYEKWADVQQSTVAAYPATGETVKLFTLE